MKNRKGFTLIELLAVIVILAIIMVIAIPQILNVINDSKEASWKNSAKMVAHAIELNSTMFDPNTGEQLFDVDENCSSSDVKESLSTIVELGDISTISCSSSGNVYTYELYGKNHFAGKTATIVCTVDGNQASCEVSGTGDAAPHEDITVDAIDEDKMRSNHTDTSHHDGRYIEHDGNKYWWMWVWEDDTSLYTGSYYSDKITVRSGERWRVSGKAVVYSNTDLNGSGTNQFTIGFAPTNQISKDFVESQSLTASFIHGTEKIPATTIASEEQSFNVTIDTPGEYYIKTILEMSQWGSSRYAAITELNVQNY